MSGTVHDSSLLVPGALEKLKLFRFDVVDTPTKRTKR